MREIGKQSKRQIGLDIKTDRLTDRQTDRQTDRYTDRQNGRTKEKFIIAYSVRFKNDLYKRK